MDLPTFLDENSKNLVALVDAIAWPVTVLAVVFFFRHEIRVKILSLAAWQGWGVDAKFTEMLAKAEESASEPVIEARDDLGQPEDVEELLIDPPANARRSFTRAGSRIIVESFRELVVELRRKADDLGVTSNGNKRLVASMVRDLVKQGAISAQLGQRILDLRDMRNLAAGQALADANDVIRYMKLADSVKRELRRAEESKGVVAQ